MRWKSQVRFGVAAARKPPAERPAPAPRRRPCALHRCRRGAETSPSVRERRSRPALPLFVRGRRAADRRSGARTRARAGAWRPAFRANRGPPREGGGHALAPARAGPIGALANRASRRAETGLRLFGPIAASGSATVGPTAVHRSARGAGTSSTHSRSWWRREGTSRGGRGKLPLQRRLVARGCLTSERGALTRWLRGRIAGVHRRRKGSRLGASLRDLCGSRPGCHDGVQVPMSSVASPSGSVSSVVPASAVVPLGP
jgi:hypothetical protein